MPSVLSRIAAFVAALGVLATPGNADATGAAEPASAGCVFARAEAPYRYYGYDHLVILTSRCEKPVRCRVSSDVRPEPVNVGVPPNAEVEVALWRGSPASVFKARVSCAP